MKMIINMYLMQSSAKTNVKYKLLHLGSEIELNEDRVKFNLTAESPQRSSRVMKSQFSDWGKANASGRIVFGIRELRVVCSSALLKPH